MTPVHPEFVPDPSLSREAMEQLQRDIADAAVFEDDFEFDPAAVGVGTGEFGRSSGSGRSGRSSRSSESGRSNRPGGSGKSGKSGAPSESTDSSSSEQTTLGEASDDESELPIVAGVDQAFVDAFSEDTLAVSAIVAARGDEVVERVHAVEPTEIPYIPGLLSFREGGAILAAFEKLSVEPDLAVLDGSGRIHFRQAGIATHVGVTLDLPTVGVAKNLLCGHPRESLSDPLPEGARVAIEADESVTAPPGTVIGYAYQSRQYDNPEVRHVNPLYVSPGHRVGAETTTDLVERLCAGYKLPEPTRLADAYADEVKAEVRE